MKALVIGAAGFVGGHLIHHLCDKGWTVSATKLPLEKPSAKAQWHDLDILSSEALAAFFEKQQADCIFHLAAQSSVALSWKNPKLTVDINIQGAVNMLEVLKELNHKPRMLLVGSGEEYGYVKPQELPINEETLLRPGNVYAATKATQGMLGALYAKAFSLDVMMARAFNHVGPGQASTFVVSDFCKQVAEIEAEKREAVIHVGNLEAKRDFSDVRDVVRAYSLLIEKGIKGETYNIGSGTAIRIQSLLDAILAQSTKIIEVKKDPARLRPSDVPVIEADIAKLQGATGWRPEISMEQTIAETLQYWRAQMQEAGK